jgi:hypothetical protein
VAAEAQAEAQAQAAAAEAARLIRVAAVQKKRQQRSQERAAAAKAQAEKVAAAKAQAETARVATAAAQKAWIQGGIAGYLASPAITPVRQPTVIDDMAATVTDDVVTVTDDMDSLQRRRQTYQPSELGPPRTSKRRKRGTALPSKPCADGRCGKGGCTCSQLQ